MNRTADRHARILWDEWQTDADADPAELAALWALVQVRRQDDFYAWLHGDAIDARVARSIANLVEISSELDAVAVDVRNTTRAWRGFLDAVLKEVRLIGDGLDVTDLPQPVRVTGPVTEWECPGGVRLVADGVAGSVRVSAVGVFTDDMAASLVLTVHAAYQRVELFQVQNFHNTP